MLIPDYVKTVWEDGDTLYGEDNYNNIENQLEIVSHYEQYRQKQLYLMGQKQYKLRSFTQYNWDTISDNSFSIAMCGDSVWFGYNTLKSMGINDPDNPIEYYTGNPNEKLDSDTVIANQTTFYYPEGYYADNRTGSASAFDRTLKKSAATKQSKVRPPEVMIEALNEVFGKRLQDGSPVDKFTLINQIYTGDDAYCAYHRWGPSGADIWMCNLGINDASADFVNYAYKGHVDQFFKYYTALIERELDNGTPCVIVTPVQQTQAASYDFDKRQQVEAYAEVLHEIGRLYGIPVIEGNDFNRNFNGNQVIDFTHMTNDGNNTIGKEMAALFIAGYLGQPLEVKDGLFLSARVQQDNINVRGNAVIDYSKNSPTMPTLLNSPDLYATEANRENMGLTVYVNYPLSHSETAKVEEGKLVYDTPDGTKVEFDLNNYPYYNVLWRQADLKARSSINSACSAIAKVPAAAYATDIANASSADWDSDNIYETVQYNEAYWQMYEKVYGLVYNNTQGLAANTTYYLSSPSAAPTSVYSEDSYAFSFAQDISLGTTYAQIYANEIQQLTNRHTDVQGQSEQGTIYYSFYCPQDGMVAVPYLYANASSVYTDGSKQSNFKVNLALDFGATQGCPQNTFEWNGEESLKYDDDELNKYATDGISVPSTAQITWSNLSSNGYYSKFQIKDYNAPVIDIVSKGWHSIRIQSDLAAASTFEFYGLQFLDRHTYNAWIKSQEQSS